MKRPVVPALILTLVVAVAGCGGGSTPSSTKDRQSAATAPASAEATSTTGDTSATTGSNYSDAICGAIRKVQADLIPVGAPADAFKVQLALALANVLPLDASTTSLIDDAAVKRECPAEFADILTQADISSLREI